MPAKSGASSYGWQAAAVHITMPTMKQRLIVRLVIAILAAVSFPGLAAVAQDWPARSVLVVNPFAAGSANDTVARFVLDQVGQQTGRPFVVENRPGGGGVAVSYTHLTLPTTPYV